MSEPRVVFVDSDNYTLSTVSGMLQEQPWGCALFDNAAEALDYLQHNVVELIASGFSLPQDGGLELLRQTETCSPDTIRVALAADSDRDQLLEAIGSGVVQRYITKPCSEIELISVVRQSVELYLLRCRYAELAQSLAHDLRLPLQSIGAAVLLANVQLRDDDPRYGELKRYLETILASASDVQKIIGAVESWVI